MTTLVAFLKGWWHVTTGVVAALAFVLTPVIGWAIKVERYVETTPAVIERVEAKHDMDLKRIEEKLDLILDYVMKKDKQ